MMGANKMSIPIETWQEWARVTALLRERFLELDQKKTRTRHVVDNTTRTSSGLMFTRNGGVTDDQE